MRAQGGMADLANPDARACTEARLHETGALRNRVEARQSREKTHRRSVTEGFFIEGDFFEQAEALRMQYEWCVAAASRMQTTAGLKYVGDHHSYRCFVATANQVIGQETLQNFLDKLRVWAKAKLD